MGYTSHSDTPISHTVQSPFLKNKSMVKSAFLVIWKMQPQHLWLTTGNLKKLAMPFTLLQGMPVFTSYLSHLLVLTKLHRVMRLKGESP